MPAETSLIRRYRQWHYQISLDGTRAQQQARVVLLTSLPHAEHPKSPLPAVLPVALVTNLQKLLLLVARPTSRKRSLPLAVVHAVPVTNKNERLLA